MKARKRSTPKSSVPQVSTVASIVTQAELEEVCRLSAEYWEYEDHRRHDPGFWWRYKDSRDALETKFRQLGFKVASCLGWIEPGRFTMRMEEGSIHIGDSRLKPPPRRKRARKL